MPYERYAILNQQTGESEVVNVRISEQGFMEWMGARDELVEAGFPDRPPDVDTEMMRLWVPHPGEENHPYFVHKGSPKLLAPDATSYPLYVAKWHSPDLTVLLQLEVREGEWRTTVVASGPAAAVVPWPDWMEPHEDHYAGYTVPKPDTSDGQLWSDVERAISAIDEAHPWPDGEPKVTDYTDILAMDVEVELAEADVARGFLSPLPEGRA